jgi:nucleotide-binding universal stress UspA family protein
MQNFKHILVATDFSECSLNALDLAVSLSTAFSARLTLFHAWEIRAYPYMEYVISSTELMSSLEAAAARRLQQSLQELHERVSWAKSELRAGVPWQQILDASKELRADLIVMGTHGRRGINHALLGSVAEKVVRFAEVPVLTVHAGAFATTPQKEQA